jgi:predicted ATPase/DNA-binding SARP family transcriptional activator/Flp pilus assembly protein TadD
MAYLTISTLGSFQITRNGELIPFDAWTTRKNLELVQILLTLHHRSVSQDELMEWLWPSLPPERARRNLRVAMSQVRRTLEPDLTQGSRSRYLLTLPTGYRWQPGDGCFVDAEVFEQEVVALRQGEDSFAPTAFAARAQAALDLYRGDYLSDLQYADWVITRRTRLQEYFLWLLTRLADQHASQGEYSAAIALCKRSLAVDNCQEQVWRRVISYHWRMGETTAALRAYADCQAVLARELDVPPEPETVALGAEIRRAATASARDIASLPARAGYPLPTPLTPLISRDDEIAAILKRLRDPRCRLLTLIGAGGMGKTRLAVTCARRLLEDAHFRDGVVFVDLAPVSEEEHLIATVASAVNLPIQGNRPWFPQLIDFLAQRELLLVLDNFEQLSAHSNLLLDLLTSSSRLKLLVTSREPLYAHGEWLVELGPLVYPAEDEDGHPAIHSALDLFLSSAERICPGFGDDPAQIKSVATICRLVEGNPLAIELAASLVRQHRSVEIAAGIRRSHRFLQTTLLGMPERHRSIAALFDHSWHLLTRQEQRILAALSTFSGGWDLPAAQAVAATTPLLLNKLCDRLLVRRVEDNRYQMHELLRQFAADRLADDPEQEIAARTRHRAYFADFYHRYGLALQRADQRQALARCQADLDNARAAWRWALAQDAWADLSKLAQGLYGFYQVRSRFQEGAHLLAEALQKQPQGEVPLSERLYALAVVLVRLGNFQVHLGDFDQARALLDQGLSLAIQQGSDVDAALALIGLGTADQQQGDYTEAERRYREARTYYDPISDNAGLAQTLNALGVVAARTGRFPEAEACYRESMDRYAEVGDRWSMTQPANNLAILAYTHRNYAQAQALFQQNLPVFQEIGDAKGEALTLSNLGTLAREEKDLSLSRSYYLRSLDLFAAIGNRWAVANAHANLGMVYVALNDFVEAQMQFRQALIQTQTLRAEPLLLYICVGCASLFAAQQRTHQARGLLDYALTHTALKAETRLLAESLRITLDQGISNQSDPHQAHPLTLLSNEDPIATVVEQLLTIL